MSAPRSAPFSDRELNGTQLIAELSTLRGSGVTVSHLLACDQELKGIDALGPTEAAARINELAVSRFSDVPPLAQVLLRWARYVKLQGDPPAFREHFSRLALTASLLGAIWQAAAQLPPRRGK